jgi:Zn-dependent protease with chaperone function
VLPSFSLLIAVAVYLLQQLSSPGVLPSESAEAPAWLPLLLLPLVLGGVLESTLRARLDRGRAPSVLWRRCFLSYSFVSALTFAVVLLLGEWPGYLESRAFDWPNAARFCLTFAPFLVAEGSTRWIEQRIVRLLANHGYRGLNSFGMRRLRECSLLLLLLALAVLRDLLEANGVAAVAVAEIGGLEVLLACLYVAVLALLAPDLFRFVQGTEVLASRWLRDELEILARRIGFRFRQLLLWRTGEEVTNAAIVGTFSWNRFVLLSDGLTAAFDLASIRAVFAHEAGHALRHHGIHLLVLVIGVPALALLSLDNLVLVDFEHPDAVTWSALTAAGLFGVISLRWASHRFEIEADLFSAAALGGAEPGIRALSTLADQMGHVRTRSSWRHPSLDRRIGVLLRAENDPLWHRAWRRRGTSVLLAAYVLLGALAGLLVTDLVRRTPLDLAAFAVYTGRLESAEQRLRRNPAVLDVHDQQRLVAIGRSLELTRVLAPDDVLPEARVQRVRLLAPRRAARALEQGELHPAVEWLELAVSVGGSSRQTQLLLGLCSALQRRDAERSQYFRSYLRETLTSERNDRLLAAVERLEAG